MLFSFSAPSYPSQDLENPSHHYSAVQRDRKTDQKKEQKVTSGWLREAATIGGARTLEESKSPQK